jgi:hypothetical protein
MSNLSERLSGGMQILLLLSLAGQITSAAMIVLEYAPPGFIWRDATGQPRQNWAAVRSLASTMLPCSRQLLEHQMIYERLVSQNGQGLEGDPITSRGRLSFSSTSPTGIRCIYESSTTAGPAPHQP